MKVPVVKEWGSWAVFIYSVAAALVAGFMTRPWASGREFSNGTVLTILGLTLLINSKSSLASALRPAGRNRRHILWLLFFWTTGVALMGPFLIDGYRDFLIFSPIVLSYVILLSMGKEHYLITELNGFAIVTLSSPIVFFTISGELSLKLYAAVLIFFAAGVFKVRARIKKNFLFRSVTGLYCAAAVVVYYYMDLSVFLLLPLAENIVHVILMREEKLKTTGNTELIKGAIFIVLIGMFWH